MHLDGKHHFMPISIGLLGSITFIWGGVFLRGLKIYFQLEPIAYRSGVEWTINCAVHGIVTFEMWQELNVGFQQP